MCACVVGVNVLCVSVINCTLNGNSSVSQLPGPGPGNYSRVDHYQVQDDDIRNQTAQYNLGVTSDFYPFTTVLQFKCLRGYQLQQTIDNSTLMRSCVGEDIWNGTSNDCVRK